VKALAGVRGGLMPALACAGAASIAVSAGAASLPGAAPGQGRAQPHAGAALAATRIRYRPVGCVPTGLRVAHTSGPPRKEVALSFDDGPSGLTRRFVRMLRANHAIATFFMVGSEVYPHFRETLREELRDGDALGDHTWNHADLVLRSSRQVRGQLAGTRARILRESGYTPCVFRPPFGAYNAKTVSVARSLGLATILWDVDPNDWALPGVQAIEQRVLAEVRAGSIILSHDGGGPRGETLAAYPYIIRQLRARGYRFVTVPQLLSYRTVYQKCTRDCEHAEIEGRPPPGSIVHG
jgi:peptidoglycan/xylan/chitin deacetylase (PgdA/CDA1 family)